MLKYLLLFTLTLSQLFAVVDINNATADEFLELSGIGKAKAEKIIRYRIQQKCFTSVEELAKIEGISKKIVTLNRASLKLGKCSAMPKKSPPLSSLKDVLLNPINLFFVTIIFILGFLDYKTGKDLKSQIVSVGVLGTFVGIFIGLQSFNPDDITNSVNDILVGLKTAFFTSIVGMGLSTILATLQKFTRKEDDA